MTNAQITAATNYLGLTGAPGEGDALARYVSLLGDAETIVSYDHPIHGRPAWALLWRQLAHEINDIEDAQKAPDILAKFDDAQIKASKDFATTLALAQQAHPTDYAGALYQGLGFAHAKGKAGQVFTPRAIADFIARSTYDAQLAQGKDFSGLGQSWLDPCCGSGAFPLAILRLLRAEKLKPGVYLVMNDLDPVCADMAFVQFSYAGGYGQVHTGDFLRDAGGIQSPVSHLTVWSRLWLRLAEARKGNDK